MNSADTQRSVGRPREFDEERALEAAMNVFWAKGFKATSLADLCAATGLHKGSLYQAFGDKHRLFMSALEHYSTSEMAEVMASFSDTNTPLQNLRALIHKVADIAGRENGCMVVNTMVELGNFDGEARQAILDFGRKRLQILTGLIQSAKQAGEVRTELNPEVLAKQLMMSLAGASAMVKGLFGKEEALAMLEGLIDSWT